MRAEEMRVEIAKACGWHNVRPAIIGTGYMGTKLPGPPQDGQHINPFFGVPDYPNDLNAMAEAVASLSQTLQTAFSSVLFDVCGSWHAAVNATALQKAEAFLRTLGRYQPTGGEKL